MQYLLTEAELNELHAKINSFEGIPTRAKLQEFCTKLANTTVLTSGWAKGQIWYCILNKDEEKKAMYCDECPAKEICPKINKRWSK